MGINSDLPKLDFTHSRRTSDAMGSACSIAPRYPLSALKKPYRRNLLHRIENRGTSTFRVADVRCGHKHCQRIALTVGYNMSSDAFDTFVTVNAFFRLWQYLPYALRVHYSCSRHRVAADIAAPPHDQLEQSGPEPYPVGP